MANLYEKISDLGQDIFLLSKEKPISDRERGFLTFNHPQDVFKSAEALKSHGYGVAIKAKPEVVGKGCDLVVEFPIILALAVLRLLQKHGLKPVDVSLVNYAGYEPTLMLTTKDLDPYLMVKTSGMKLVVDKRDRKIVNVSGGGCPDAPYLSAMLVGKSVNEAPEPCSLGSTLCGYSLQLAFDEIKRIFSCG